MICQYYVEIATPIFYIAKLQMRMLNNENVAFRVLRVEWTDIREAQNGRVGLH